MRNHLSETLMLNDIQITSDYISRWVVLKRRVGAVTSQRILEVLSHLLLVFSHKSVRLARVRWYSLCILRHTVLSHVQFYSNNTTSIIFQTTCCSISGFQRFQAKFNKKNNIQNTNASKENFFNVVSESVFALDCLVVWLFFAWCFVGGRGSCGVIVSGFFFGMHHLSELIRFPVLYNDFL